MNAQNIEWTKCYGGSNYDEAYSIQQTTDGGFIVAGYSESSDGDVSGNYGLEDYWLLRLNATGDTVWTKSYGGSSDDIATAIQQTTDGGFIVAGYSNSTDGDVFGNHEYIDYWLLRLDANGDTVWTKCYGGSDDDIVCGIKQTIDGGFIVAGYSGSTDDDVSDNHGFADYWLLRLDATGDTVWTKCYGGSVNDIACGIQQTTDGGFIVAGWSLSTDGDVSGNHGGNGDFWVLRLNATGDTIWTKCYGGSGNDNAYSIQQTTDGGFIVAGYSESTDGDVSGNHGGFDYWILRLDATGDTIWTKSYGGSGDDIATAIQQTTDGGFIVAGYSESTDGDVSGNHGGFDYWILRLDATGDTIWTKCYGGSSCDESYNIQQTTDNGFIVAGWSGSGDGDVLGNHGNSDFWILKLDNSTGIVTKSLSQDIDIYPNPARNQLTIVAKNKASKTYRISIYTIQGQLLMQKIAKTKKSVLDISNLAKGLYVLKLINNNETTITKFMKE